MKTAARRHFVQAETELSPEALRERAKRQIFEALEYLIDAKIAGNAVDSYFDQTNSPLGSRRHRDLARTGVLPSVKFKRRVRILRTDVYAYMEREGLKRGTKDEHEDVDDIIDGWVGGVGGNVKKGKATR